MTKILSYNNSILEEKLSKAFTLIVKSNGELTDDTYIERLITAFGQEIEKFGNDDQGNSILWMNSGAQDLIQSTLFDDNANSVVDVLKFSIRLLGECLGKNRVILQTACRLVNRLME
jgi:hypothetical protein